MAFHTIPASGNMTERCNRLFVCVHTCVFVRVCERHPVVSNSWRPHEQQPTRLLCPWDSPGQNTGAGSRSLLQGIFPTQVSRIAGRFFTVWATREAQNRLQSQKVPALRRRRTEGALLTLGTSVFSLVNGVITAPYNSQGFFNALNKTRWIKSLAQCLAYS